MKIISSDILAIERQTFFFLKKKTNNTKQVIKCLLQLTLLTQTLNTLTLVPRTVFLGYVLHLHKKKPPFYSKIQILTIKIFQKKVKNNKLQYSFLNNHVFFNIKIL